MLEKEAVYTRDICPIRLSLNLIFYNVYETSYTTYIIHARWHRCLRSDGLRVGGNRIFDKLDI